MSGPLDRDPGAASERTTLAWHRTGLSAAAAAALSLRVFAGRLPLGPLLVVLLVVVTVVSYLPEGHRLGAPARLRVVSGCVSSAAVAALVLAATGP